MTLTLIARRSRKFAGTRYLKRGINTDGYVANDVEVEQIIEVGGLFQSGALRISSMVQVRGSVPLLWSQSRDPGEAQYLTKPSIRMLHFLDPRYEATRKHFDDLMGRYGCPVACLDLLRQNDRRRQESTLSKEYAKAVHGIQADYAAGHRGLAVGKSPNTTNTNNSTHCIAYSRFDLRRHTRGVTSSSLLRDLQAVQSPLMKATGFFAACGTTVQRVQHGVVRTNCMDCLDRTNVAQFSYGLLVLGDQLHTLGVSPSTQLDPASSLAAELMNAYEKMGNALALQYGGSEAHTGVFEKWRGNWDALMQSRNVLTSLRRFYSNVVTDEDKQEAINLFLGTGRGAMFAGNHSKLGRQGASLSRGKGSAEFIVVDGGNGEGGGGGGRQGVVDGHGDDMLPIESESTPLDNDGSKEVTKTEVPSITQLNESKTKNEDRTDTGDGDDGEDLNSIDSSADDSPRLLHTSLSTASLASSFGDAMGIPSLAEIMSDAATTSLIEECCVDGQSKIQDGVALAAPGGAVAAGAVGRKALFRSESTVWCATEGTAVLMMGESSSTDAERALSEWQRHWWESNRAAAAAVAVSPLPGDRYHTKDISRSIGPIEQCVDGLNSPQHEPEQAMNKVSRSLESFDSILHAKQAKEVRLTAVAGHRHPYHAHREDHHSQGNPSIKGESSTHQMLFSSIGATATSWLLSPRGLSITAAEGSSPKSTVSAETSSAGASHQTIASPQFLPSSAVQATRSLPPLSPPTVTVPLTRNDARFSYEIESLNLEGMPRGTWPASIPGRTRTENNDSSLSLLQEQAQESIHSSSSTLRTSGKRVSFATLHTLKNFMMLSPRGPSSSGTSSTRGISRPSSVGDIPAIGASSTSATPMVTSTGAGSAGSRLIDASPESTLYQSLYLLQQQQLQQQHVGGLDISSIVSQQTAVQHGLDVLGMPQDVSALYWRIKDAPGLMKARETSMREECRCTMEKMMPVMSYEFAAMKRGVV